MTPLRQTVVRYRSESPSLYYYAIGKIRLDPAYPAVAEMLKNSPRPLLDVGCGVGLLAAYLRTCGHKAPITGLDIDTNKIAIANKVLGGENATFASGDARRLPNHRGDIILLDVLHYFTDAEQEALLSEIAARIAPGGVALIRIALRQRNLRHALTQLEETFIKLVKWIPVTGRNFPTREKILAAFPGEKFQTSVEPMWGLTPFNSHLFVVRSVHPSEPIHSSTQRA